MSNLSKVIEEQHSSAETTEFEALKKKISLQVASDSADESEHVLVCTVLNSY